MLPAATMTNNTSSSAWLRIIQINDVYELDHLPRFKTLVDVWSKSSSDTIENSTEQKDESQQQQQQQPDRTIVICCGDFVAPSLLSSLDEGYSMIDIFNQCRIDYVCLGNHEADISISALQERIVQQSQFTWINTNIVPKDTTTTINTAEKATADTAAAAEATATTITPSTKIMTLPFDHMPTSVEIVVGENKKVILLGLLTNDPSLYRPNAFGGNITILSIYECIQREYQKQQQQQQQPTTNIMDPEEEETSSSILILPMTHQSIQQDRILAQQILQWSNENNNDDVSSPSCYCPIICGGHDHEVYNETISQISAETTNTRNSCSEERNKTCQIVKAGMDAQNAAIIDIKWEEVKDVVGRRQPPPPPNITVEIVPTSPYEPDAIVQQQVLKHQAILKELEEAKLFRISDWIVPVTTTTEDDDGDDVNHCSNNNESVMSVFTTVNNRIQSSTGTSAICTMIQMGIRATCCIINAGAIRGNTNYKIDSYFTWKHLKNEIPFSTEICVCAIPGFVIEDMIQHSRIGAYHHNPPIASGGYLHTCHNIQLKEEKETTTKNRTVRIVSIRGEPFDPTKEYLVALPKQFFDGIDHHIPLLEWAKKYPPTFSDENCIPAKVILVQVFAATMWLSLGQFYEIDIDQDGYISRNEIRNRLLVLNDGCREHVADLIVDNVLSICDLNDDGMISPIEMMICQYVATDMLRHVGTRDEIRTITNIVMNVLGDTTTKNNSAKNPNITSYDDVARLVDQVRNTIDIHGDGTINRHEIAKVFKGKIQRGSDLLH